MLINLSNHPLTDWQPDQLEEAKRRFVSVVDMDFPAIDPDWELDTIDRIALQTAKDCMDMLTHSTDKTNAIHVMGELTFCFRFVRLMQQQNIPCLASTTSRQAELTPKGKLSVFTWKKFRPYF